MKVLRDSIESARQIALLRHGALALAFFSLRWPWPKTARCKTERQQTAHHKTTRLKIHPQLLPQAITSGTIHGVVKSGSQPLPGVTVTAANTLTGQKVSTSSDLDGSYTLQVPVNRTLRGPRANGGIRRKHAGRPHQRELLPTAGGYWNWFYSPVLQSKRHRRSSPLQWGFLPVADGAGEGNQRGFQSMSVMQSDATDNWQGGVRSNGNSALPGMSDTAATESVSVAGNTSNPFGNMSSTEMQQRFQEMRQQYSGNCPVAWAAVSAAPSAEALVVASAEEAADLSLAARAAEEAAVAAASTVNQPHGSVYYDVQDGALNASPFSVTGQPTSKPDFISHRFGASLGGPLNIPKIYKGGSKTFFFVNYNGTRGETPFDEFSTVPTAAERAGNFTGIANIVDPSTGSPFANDTIPQINPIAQGLFAYIPMPNLPGATQNFHFVTATNTSGDDLNIRLNRTLGATTTRQGGRGRGRGPRNV